MDLGADTWQAFRYVTPPVVGTALLAGGLLAFALSFDEVHRDHLHRRHAEDAAAVGVRQPQAGQPAKLAKPAPAGHVVAVLVILLSAIPVYLAQRLSSDSGPTGRT